MRFNVFRLREGRANTHARGARPLPASRSRWRRDASPARPSSRRADSGRHPTPRYDTSLSGGDPGSPQGVGHHACRAVAEVIENCRPSETAGWLGAGGSNHSPRAAPRQYGLACAFWRRCGSSSHNRDGGKPRWTVPIAAALRQHSINSPAGRDLELEADHLPRRDARTAARLPRPEGSRDRQVGRRRLRLTLPCPSVGPGKPAGGGSVAPLAEMSETACLTVQDLLLPFHGTEAGPPTRHPTSTERPRKRAPACTAQLTHQRLASSVAALDASPSAGNRNNGSLTARPAIGPEKRPRRPPPTP